MASFSCAPLTVGVNATLPCNVVVGNQGLGTASFVGVQIVRSNDASITTGDAVVATCSITTVVAGGSTFVSCDGSFSPSAGAFYVGAIIDPASAISEFDETNNTSLALGPVLVGPNLEITGNSCTPDATTAGTTVTCTGTLINSGAGTAASGNFVVKLSSNGTIDAADTTLGTCSTSTLAGGASRGISCSGAIPAATASGVYYLGLLADSSSTTPESIEDNSIAGDSVMVGVSYTSCLPLLNANPSAPTGSYNIDVDGSAGPLAPLNVHCNMTTDGGGYTTRTITNGISTTRFDQANSCTALGMNLVIPRTHAHLDYLLARYAGATYFLTVPGVYGLAAGDYRTCAMNSGTACGANWKALDNGAWFARSSPTTEPSGNYTPGCWLAGFTWAPADASGFVFDDGACVYATGTSYICSTNDKP